MTTPPIPDQEVEKLRELAKKATPGKRSVVYDEASSDVVTDDNHADTIARDMLADDANLTAALDTETVANLCTELLQSRAEIKRLREALIQYGAHEPECGEDNDGDVITDECTCGLDAALHPTQPAEAKDG